MQPTSLSSAVPQSNTVGESMHSVAGESVSSPKSGQVITISDLAEAFPGQYVLVTDCRFDDDGRVTEGRPLISSHSAKLCYEWMDHYQNSVILYLGPARPDLEGAFLDLGEAYRSR